MHKNFYKIYEDIQKKIQEEFFLPGQKITEIELMNEYHCSRGTIRTIISWCDVNNILDVKPKVGTYVTEETQKSFRDKVEVRTYLEKLACRLLIQHATKKEIQEIEYLFEKMSHELAIIPYSPKIFSDIHYQFHSKIIKYSNNDFLVKSFSNLNLRYSYLFAEGASTDVRVLIRSNNEHRDLLCAIKKKDIILAEKIVEDHLWEHKVIPPSIRRYDEKST